MEGLTIQGIVDLVAKLTAIGLAFVLLVLLISAFRRLIEVQFSIAKSNEATAASYASAATVTAGALSLMAGVVDKTDKRVVDFGIADKQRSDQLGIDIADVPNATHKLVKPDVDKVETAVEASKDEVLAKLVLMTGQLMSMTEQILELLLGQKNAKVARDEKETALAAHASAIQAVQMAEDETRNREAALTIAVQTAVDKALPPALQTAVDKTLPPVQQNAIDKTLPPAVQEAIDKTLPPALKAAVEKTPTPPPTGD